MLWLSILLSRWRRPSGYGDVLRISLPLVISMGSHTVMLFTDRLFLGRYSLDAIAAATPAGMLAFMFLCFFMGVIGFTNTLVAQYSGAGAPRRIGSAIWQAIYFTFGAGLILAALAPTGRFIFGLAGHPPEIQQLEYIYFTILMLGSVFSLLHDSLACFYSGRGLTKVIMIINLIGMTVNVPLNYMLINGLGALPALGIAGAAIGTVISHLVMLIVFSAVIFTNKNEAAYGVRTQRAFDRGLFMRLLKFGGPAGVQFFVDTFAFTFFLLMIGRIGRNELAATNLTLALGSLAFMPMIGFSIAVSTLVGQAIGRGRPQDGAIATSSALHLTSLYMWSVALIFLLFPMELCGIFQAHQDPAEFMAVRAMAVILLRFVAFYSLLDVFNVIFSGALKGAGDTIFIGWTVVILTISVMVAPVYLAVVKFQAGVYIAWIFATAYVCLLALVFYGRYRYGHWKNIQLIEPPRLLKDLAGPLGGAPGSDILSPF